MRCKNSMMHSPLISLKGIEVKREGSRVLENVDLDIFKGDFLAITGPNGGGKTTLLRVMLKLMAPTKGSVTYFGDDGLPIQRLDIGYLPQKNSIDSRFPLSVREVVTTGLMVNKNLTTQQKTDRVTTTLQKLHLVDRSEAPIGEISGGQLQRALLGRAIVSEPSILVLDEPLSYLDRHFIEEIYVMLRELAAHTTIILVSHEMTRIAEMANRHILVDHTVRSCHAHNHYFAPLPCDV